MSDLPFIEIDYTGRVDGVVFDTTLKVHALPGNKGPFEPAVLKLGSGQLIAGLDAFLTGKQPGAYSVKLQPEEAFGRKQPQLLKLVPLAAFGKDAQRIAPGFAVSIGDEKGRVQSVSGGRVVVDFNHPLAGQVVEYHVKLHGLVTDQAKKVRSVVRAMLGVDLPVEHREGKTLLSLPAGFPADGLVKEIERHSGVIVTVVEVAVKPQASPAPAATTSSKSASKKK